MKPFILTLFLFSPLGALALRALAKGRVVAASYYILAATGVWLLGPTFVAWAAVNFAHHHALWTTLGFMH